MLDGDFRYWINRIVQEVNRDGESRGIAPLAKRTLRMDFGTPSRRLGFR